MASSNSPKTQNIAAQLCDFIAESPTPFHATKTALSMFLEAGFTHLKENDEWHISASSAYVVTRNDSSIIAFRTGKDLHQGMQMIGAHTDSPCLRIKPNPQINKHGYLQLGVEVYGGALFQPWLDRDLSIAGRVSGVNSDGEVISELIDFKCPIAIIPNLAIHLEREANSKRVINPQLHLPLILGSSENLDFDSLLIEQCKTGLSKVMEYELSVYDTQKPSITGLKGEFVSSARLDNLLSTYIGAQAIIDTDGDQASLFVSTDHEEVGSASACGAQGPFLRNVLERLIPGTAELTQFISKSSMLSCDNAHGIHPNYADKHDQNHGPILNQGPVIKINQNQRYATTSVSSAKFQRRCEQAGVPIQKFVTRSDMGCGSTIGPITATELGIETLDLGAPQWAMHSIRETAGSKDCEYLYQAVCAFIK
ncbi:MAG: M18 family aminopeptidase [Gammaproteobacteria bacterium]|nr:M18 family aminopeptidase [Gammaproteobacteria bacterium]